MDGIEIRRMPKSDIPGLPKSLLRLLVTAWSLFVYWDDYDIAYFADGAGTAWLAIPLLKLLGKPVVVESTLLGADDASARREQIFGQLRIRILKLADRLFCVSRALSDTFRDHNFPSKKVKDLPYGIDLNIYKPVKDEKLKRLRNNLNIPPSSRVISFVGGINRRKNVHTLVRSFVRISEKFTDTHLYLIGPCGKQDYGRYPEKIKNIIKEGGVEDRVNMTGMTENVHEYLKASDIYVSASTAEGLPLGVLEAMACLNACILLDTPATRDLVPSSKYGIVVEKNSPKEFAKALCRLLKGKSMTKSIAESAKRRIERKFELKDRAEKTKKILNRLT
jgi:glycosyltransferase involved in cell wall biosynthesis